jgi:hypothetical protein
MKIRNEQMASLAALKLDEFVASTAAHVERAYPEVAYRRTAAEMDALVRGFVAEAERYGLSGEYPVLRYIEVRLGSRGGLVDAPGWAWAREILGDSALSEDEKIDRLDTLAWGGPLRPSEE